MNHKQVREAIASRLLTQPGWEQHPEHDHHFRHPPSGVHVLVYGQQVSVTFGRKQGSRYDKAVAASTRYFAELSVESALEVAEALVFRRLVLDHRPDRGRSMNTGDMLLLIALREPGISQHDALNHPLWTSGLSGFVRRPGTTTMHRATLELRSADLVQPNTAQRYLTLTDSGREVAEALAVAAGLSVTPGG